MSKLLTLKAIAKELDVPESSLRKYREIFSDFIPSVGRGRSRRYKTEAIEVLREIRRLREDDHLPWESITDKLARQYPIEIEAETPDNNGRQGDMFNAGVQNGVAPQLPQQPATVVADGAIMRKISALGEQQTMMMNALALEMIKSVESVSASSKKESRDLKDNITRTLSNFAAGIDETGRRDRKLLKEVQAQLGQIDEKLTGLNNSASDENSAKLKELQTVLDNVRGRLDEKEQLMKEYQLTVEALKAENEKLKESRRGLEQKLREKSRQGTAIPSQQQARPATSSTTGSSSSSKQQPSFFSKIFGKK